MATGEIQGVVNRFLERLAALNAEREKILATLEMLRSEGADIPAELPSASWTGADLELPGKSKTPPTPGPRSEIRPDTFFGLSHHKAARRYLSELGHADKLENILNALTAGGVNIGGANPTETLRAVLRQNSSVFVRVSENTYGLREFYPHLGDKNPKDVNSRKKRSRKGDRTRGRRGLKPKSSRGREPIKNEESGAGPE